MVRAHYLFNNWVDCSLLLALIQRTQQPGWQTYLRQQLQHNNYTSCPSNNIIILLRNLGEVWEPVSLERTWLIWLLNVVVFMLRLRWRCIS